MCLGHVTPSGCVPAYFVVRVASRAQVQVCCVVGVLVGSVFFLDNVVGVRRVFA